jgi:hypothetical protein
VSNKNAAWAYSDGWVCSSLAVCFLQGGPKRGMEAVDGGVTEVDHSHAVRAHFENGLLAIRWQQLLQHSGLAHLGGGGHGGVGEKLDSGGCTRDRATPIMEHPSRSSNHPSRSAQPSLTGHDTRSRHINLIKLCAYRYGLLHWLSYNDILLCSY